MNTSIGNDDDERQAQVHFSAVTDNASCAKAMTFYSILAPAEMAVLMPATCGLSMHRLCGKCPGDGGNAVRRRGNASVYAVKRTCVSYR